jgi:hypothetical protein
MKNQSAKRDLPNGDKENANLILYCGCRRERGKEARADLHRSLLADEGALHQGRQPLTTGGFVPNEEGYKVVAELLATGIYGHQSRESKADPEL